MNIDKTGREDLKKYFEKYDVPTESQFAEVLDAVLTQADDGIVRLTGQPLSISSEGSDENLISFYTDFDSDTPSWVLSQNAGSKSGFNFSESSDGASRLFIQSSTGHVGINTNDPLKKLHVEEGELRVRGSHNGPAPDLATFMANNLTQGIGIGYNRIQAIGTNTSQSICILPRGGVGHVGINTQSPNAMLTVDGDALFTDALTITQGKDGDTLIKAYNSDDDGILDLYQDNTVTSRIHANGNSYFNGGNVGIGTDSPASLLHVSSAGDAILTLTADTADSDETANPMIRLRQDGNVVGMNIGFDNTNFGENRFGIGRRMSSVDHWDTLVINAATGHVGIGTNAPGETLEVSGSANISGTFKLNGTAVTATAAELNTLDGITATVSELNTLDGITADVSELNTLDGITSTTDELNYVDVSPGILTAGKAVVANSSSKINNLKVDDMDLDDNVVKASSSSGLYLQDDGGNGIFIQDGGNVGIGSGSPAPTDALYVSSAVNGAGITISSPRPVLTLDDSDANGWAMAIDSTHLKFNEDTLGTVLTLAAGGNVTVNSGTFTAGSINLNTNTIRANDDNGLYLQDNASNGIYVQDGGNVGIGNTGPSEALDVTGNIKASGQLEIDGSSNSYFSGNVSIGSSATPSEALDVYGNIDVSAAAPLIKFSSTGTPRISNVTAGFGTASAGDQSLQFNVSDNTTAGTTAVMTLLGSGNVGVGVTDPNELLEVGGNIKSSGVLKMNGSGSSYFNGNLGVGGITSPTTALQAGGTIKASGNLQIDGTGNSYFGGSVAIGVATAGEYLLRVASTNLDHATIKIETDQSPGHLNMGGWDSGWNINNKTHGKHLYINRDAGSSTNLYLGRKGIESIIRGTDGYVGILNTNPSEALDVTGNIEATGVLQMLGSGDSYFTGNLGVGVTTPGYALDVGTTIRTNTLLFNALEQATTNDASGEVYFDENYHADYAAITGGNGGGLAVKTEDGWGAVIATNNMQWITPVFNGGTFNGNVSMGDKEITNLRGIRMKDWDDGSGGQDQTYFLVARDGALVFYGGGVAIGPYANGALSDVPNGYLIVQNRIGIGLTNPSEALDVNGNIEATGVLKMLGTGDSYFGGQLGLGGITSPSYALDVGTTIRTNTLLFNALEQATTNDASGEVYFDENYSADYAAITGGDGGGLAVKTEDGWGAVIATNNMQWIKPVFNGATFNNWVGVGTSTPGATLHVKGVGMTDASVFIQPNGSSIGDNATLYLASGDHYIRGEYGSGMTLYDTEQFTFLGANVSIGTSTPTSNYVLDVGGGVINSCGIVVNNTDNSELSSHINEDGAIYRYAGQVYFTVDDNIYFRDTDGGLDFHFLTGSGEAYKSSGSGTWSGFSDIRIKKNIREFEDGLAEIRQIRTKRFQYTGEANMKKDLEQIGVIAQEIQEVLPYTVKVEPQKLKETDEKETDLLAFDPSALTYVLINAVQEMDEKMQQMAATIEALQQKVEALS